MKSRSGVLLTVTGVLACPCHLHLTLPLLIGLLGETSLGTFLRENPPLLFAGASRYFLAAIGTALVLVARSGGDRKDASEGCIPGTMSRRAHHPRAIEGPSRPWVRG